MIVGIDESGCGPLFGRVYAAAVILPPDFNFHILKDSKKFTSKKKINEVSNEIKEKALYYGVAYLDEKYIDEHNILNSKIKCMWMAIDQIIEKMPKEDITNIKLYVDGNYFKQYIAVKDEYTSFVEHNCIVKGDTFINEICAASIIAKTERDNYIYDLCEKYPEYNEKYFIMKNKGYGTKQHLEGIKKYGLSDMHRKSYKISI